MSGKLAKKTINDYFKKGQKSARNSANELQFQVCQKSFIRENYFFPSMKLSFASYIMSSIEVIFFWGLEQKERSFLNP